MNEQRALLDQLMGKARDVPDAIKQSLKEVHFSDAAVCKYSLCGLCPYATFLSTKSDMGPCRAELCDSEETAEMSRKYLALDKSQRDRYGYEYDLMRVLEGIVHNCDQAIAKKKLRAEKEEAIPEDILAKLAQNDTEIKALNEKCVAAAEEGDIDLSQEYAKQIEMLKEVTDKLITPTAKTSTVCEVSGNIVSNRDNNDRMRAHFEGKQYLGWKSVRDKLKALQAMDLVHPGSLASSARRGNGENRLEKLRRSRSRSRSREKDRTTRDRDKYNSYQPSRHHPTRSRSRDRGQQRSSDQPPNDPRPRALSRDWGKEKGHIGSGASSGSRFTRNPSPPRHRTNVAPTSPATTSSRGGSVTAGGGVTARSTISEHTRSTIATTGAVLADDLEEGEERE